MAAGDGRREVPDSDDEPMTSSPASVSDGVADKLSATAPVPLQDAQHALQEAARPHQANAEHHANMTDSRTDGLDADHEIASVDVDATQKTQTATPPHTAIPQHHHDGEASSHGANHPTCEGIAISESATAMSVGQHDRHAAVQAMTDEPQNDAVSKTDNAVDVSKANDGEEMTDVENQAGILPRTSSSDDIRRQPHKVLETEASNTNGTVKTQAQRGPAALDSSDRGEIGHIDESDAVSTGAQVATYIPNDEAARQSSRTDFPDTLIDNRANDYQGSPDHAHSGAANSEVTMAREEESSILGPCSESDVPTRFAAHPSEPTVRHGRPSAQSTTIIDADGTHLNASHGTGHSVAASTDHASGTTILPESNFSMVTDPDIDSGTAAIGHDDPKAVLAVRAQADGSDNADQSRRARLDYAEAPTIAKTPQEITLAELKAQKAALLASLATLPAIQVLMEENAEPTQGDEEPTESEIMAAANKIVKDHIRLLHEYNELKDVGQGLMGLISDQRGVRIVEVQEEFGIDAKD